MDAKTKAWPASAPQKAGDGPKYPHVRVDLAKEDQNPFAILNRTETALRQAGIPASERREYLQEAMSGDYEHRVSVTKRWVSTYKGRPCVRAGKRRR